MLFMKIIKADWTKRVVALLL